MNARMHWPMLVALCFMQVACVSIPDQVYGLSPGPEALGTAGTEVFVIDAMEGGELSCQGPTGKPTPCKTRLERMGRWLSQESTTAPIVVFVHGWHHNGSDGDKNLKGFKMFLLDLEARRRLDQAADPSVDGIYVAWRGDQVRVLGPDWMQLLDFPTVWSRKKASVSVGSVGMKEIVTYLRANYPRRAVMVTGLSFGSSVVFHSVQDSLGNKELEGFEFIMMNPAVSETEFDGVAQRVRKQRKAELSMMSTDMLALERERRQLMVLQSLGDRAVKWGYDFAFPGKPIGFSPSWQTHHASVCTGADCPPAPVLGAGECYRRLPGNDVPALVIRATLNTDKCIEQMRDPIWVVTGGDAVSKDHNDIFNSTQARALAAHLVYSIRQAEERVARKTQ